MLGISELFSMESIKVWLRYGNLNIIGQNRLLTQARQGFSVFVMLARGERCPVGGTSPGSRSQEERKTEKPWLAGGCSCQLSITESTLSSNSIASSKHL